MRHQFGGGGDNRVNDGGESGSEVRVAVIAAANAIATAAAMEVAAAMASDAARWWFSGVSSGCGNNNDLGRQTTTSRQPT